MSDIIPNITNPRYVYSGGLLNLEWEENEYGENNTEFYIECKSKKGVKEYTSEKMTYYNGQFLPGYYYKVNTNPIDTVKSTDSYTMDSKVNLDYAVFDKSKQYYFHVASVNEFGNLSKTRTLELDLEEFTSLGEMKDASRNLLYRGKDVESDDFRRVTDEVYNAFTTKTVDLMENRKLKIILTGTDIKEYISVNHNAKVTNANAQYIKNDNVIIYNVTSDFRYLLKEIVKFFNTNMENPWSKNEEFLKVYKSESINIGNGKLNAENFFYEAVASYILENDELKYISPGIYNFINKNYTELFQ
jgi:hypothetical protein